MRGTQEPQNVPSKVPKRRHILRGGYKPNHDDFLAVVKPIEATVESQWTPRGGLHSNIVVKYPEKTRGA